MVSFLHPIDQTNSVVIHNGIIKVLEHDKIFSNFSSESFSKYSHPRYLDISGDPKNVEIARCRDKEGSIMAPPKLKFEHCVTYPYKTQLQAITNHKQSRNRALQNKSDVFH